MVAVFVRVAPTIAVAAAVWGLAWLELGSIAARDWLLYAILTVLLLAAVLVSGAAARPTRAAAVAILALLALAAWTAISLTWSPAPALARDEALLIVFYAAAFAIPALTLRTGRDRMTALAGLVFLLGALTVAVAFTLRFGPTDDLPTKFLRQGRLYWPVSYVNGQAALFLVGFWPAVMLAARRGGGLAVRAAAAACGSAFLAGWLLTQSRGALAALAFSALVVFALVPARLRLLLPAALAAGPAAAASPRLTDAYTLTGAALIEPVRAAAEAMLLATAGGLVLGAAYAALDGRVVVPARVARTLGIGLAAAAVATTAAAAAIALPRIDFAERWERLQHDPGLVEAPTHLANPGTNRYEFWEVAAREFARHPIAGIGARGFFSAYLRAADDDDETTPIRAHSLPLDVLAELGVVGFAALAVALGALGAGLVRRRAAVPAAAGMGALAYWLAHAAIDWTWTLPAVGLPLFVLAGIGVGARGSRRLAARRRWTATAAAVALAVAVLAPTWLSARLVASALADGDAGDLRLARRLDPLSTEPLLAEALLAASPAARIAPLARAAEREPRSVAVRVSLFHAYRAAGRTQEARRELLRAIELAPGDDDLRRLLRPSQ